MLYQRAFHLERPDQMPRRVDDVVRAPNEPVVAVFIHAGAVAGDVPSLTEARVVHFGVVPIGMEHRRPVRAHNQIAVFAHRHGLVLIVHDAEFHARNGASHRAGLHILAGVVGAQNSARFRLPPVVVERHAEHRVAPHHRLRVKRLAHARDEAQRGHIVALGNIVPRLHQHSDGGGRGVPHRYLVILYQLIPLACAEAALIYELRNAVGPRREHPIGCAGDPARIRRAEIDVVRLQVKRPLAGGVLLNNRLMPMRGALWLARRPRCVVHNGVVVLACNHRFEVGGSLRHLFFVAQIARHQRHGIAVVLVDDEHMLQFEEFGDDARNLAPQIRLRNQHLGGAVLHPVFDRIRPERREQRPRDCARLQYAEEGDVEFGQALHVDEYAIALLYAEAFQHIGELVGLFLHLPEGVGFFFAVLPFPNHRYLIAVAPVGVAVDGFVRLVKPAARQPV